MFGFLAGGFAGGDDADEFVFDFNVYDGEQAPSRVPANGGIARLMVARCIDHPEKGIEEYFGGFFKRNAVLIVVVCCFGPVPYKHQAVEFEADIHDVDYALVYFICQYS